MARTADPYDLFPSDLPDVWEPVPDEYREMLKIKNGIATGMQRRMIDAILASRWYLIKNDSTDEFGNRRPCRHCHRLHDYVTVRCIEAPFTSLTEVMGIIRKADGVYVQGDKQPDQFDSMEFDAQVLGKIVPISISQAYDHIRKIRGRGVPIYPHIP